jgi:hypothetical protein
VHLSADFVSPDGATPQVVVSGSVDLAGVPFVEEGGRRQARVDVAGALFDESGALVGRLETERAALTLTDGDYARARANGLDYQKAALVKPGRYRVAFAVRDEASGKRGGSSQWIDVPDLGAGKLTLSSLFLLKKEESSGDGVPGAEGASLLSAQARRRFRKGESLYVQVFAYNPQRGADGAADLVGQAEIWRGGERLAATAPEPLDPGSRGAPPVPHTQGLKLGPLGPGEYEVRMVVTDRRAKAMVSHRAGFTIE